MATYLFCWELGAGRGHVAPHLGLTRLLRDRGHEVIFAVRNLKHAETLLGRAGYRYLQAPTWVGPQAGLVGAARSYPQVLLNVGYHDVDQLVGWARAWRELFAATGADALLVDHAPTALLAARGLDLPAAVLGNGFVVPPLRAPLPPLTGALDGAVRDDEARALEHVNAAASLLAAPTLERLADLFDVEVRAVRSFPEFDHYAERDDVAYVPVAAGHGGEAPSWPGESGRPRAFAYLSAGPLLETALTVLARRRIPTLVSGDGLPGDLVDRLAGETMRFTATTYDLERVAREADLVLLNANHSTTLTLLLAGAPLLLLPQQLEQALFAERVAALGAARVVRQPKQTAVDLAVEALLHDTGPRRAAEAFAGRHAGHDFAADERDLVDRIERMVTHPRRAAVPTPPAGRALH
ncbi:MAG: hypothetical protein R3298_12425 [Gammaproteobacteria bacterium]|nr:hypothetical protein [Gammaproteobacteria bacterium]